MTNIGPQIPPHLLNVINACSDEDKKDDDDSFYGPSLPPGFPSTENKVIGPSIPSHILKSINKDDSEEDDFIGPSLLTHNEDNVSNSEQVQKEIEQRAEAMKNKLLGKTEEVVERESWMLELPPSLSKNFGLGPRTFRANPVELGDRSVWTETPASREHKRKEREEAAKSGVLKKKKPIEIHQPSKDDIETQTRITEYNMQNRPQSLLEMHRSKQKSSDDSKIRRPFDREADLKLNRSNPKETAKFIESAKSFSDKFSGGSYEKKFL
uniref:Uncharacterized protein KIAA1704 n=1 Tax=Hydra vulgaris TaxID=6087 RepID=T2MA39_HYDVU